MFLGDLGARTHIGIEAHPQVGELGFEARRGHEACVAVAGEGTSSVTGHIVGTCPLLHGVQGAAPERRPDPPAEEPEHRGQDGHTGERHENGDRDLIPEVGTSGVAKSAAWEPVAGMADEPRGHPKP